MALKKKSIIELNAFSRRARCPERVSKREEVQRKEKDRGGGSERAQPS
jgi:hypothetical protein